MSFIHFCGPTVIAEPSTLQCSILSNPLILFSTLSYPSLLDYPQFHQSIFILVCFSFSYHPVKAFFSLLTSSIRWTCLSSIHWRPIFILVTKSDSPGRHMTFVHHHFLRLQVLFSTPSSPLFPVFSSFSWSTPTIYYPI